MPDNPEIPETAPGATPNAALGAPTAAAQLAAAVREVGHLHPPEAGDEVVGQLEGAHGRSAR